MKKEILKTIQAYLRSYYTNDYQAMMVHLDEEASNNYVEQFVSFAEQMDEFGETDDFLSKIGVDDLATLKKLSTSAFLTKIFELTKQEIDEARTNKILKRIVIKNIEIENDVASVEYTYPVSYYGGKEHMKSIMPMSKKGGEWKIHFKSQLDIALSSFQKQIDDFKKRKAKDQLENLNHHLNDLEKITLIGYQNMSGEIVFEPRFKDAGNFSGGMAYVKVMSKYGYIDQTGEIVIKPQFRKAANFSDDLAAVQIGKSRQWGFINKKGAIVIEPAYDEVSEFNEGLCAVEKDEKWGYIDNKGKVLIPFQFIEADDFWSDEAEVAIHDKDGYLETVFINKKGEIQDEEE